MATYREGDYCTLTRRLVNDLIGIREYREWVNSRSDNGFVEVELVIRPGLPPTIRNSGRPRIKPT